MAALHEVTLEDRAVRIEGYVSGTNRENMYKRRMQLAGILNPTLKAGTLIYQNDYGTKVISAVPEEAPVFTERTANYQKFSVTMICPQPFLARRKRKQRRNSSLDWQLRI